MDLYDRPQFVGPAVESKLDEEFRAYRILGVCNPPLAFRALQLEDKLVSAAFSLWRCPDGIIGITIWARAQLWDHRRLMSLIARQIAPARFPYPTKAT